MKYKRFTEKMSFLKRTEVLENITASNEPNLLREMARIPYYSLNAKTCEGWIHRKRFAHETSYRGKWIKCWMVLCSSVLFIYSNKSVSSSVFYL